MSGVLSEQEARDVAAELTMSLGEGLRARRVEQFLESHEALRARLSEIHKLTSDPSVSAHEAIGRIRRLADLAEGES